MNRIVLKNILQLASGTVISQLILFSATPFLTRIYSPSDFGLFTIFASASALLAGCLTLKFDAAVPLPRSNREALCLSRVTLQLSLFLSITVLVFLLFIGVKGNTISVFLLTPLATYLSAYITVHQQWGTRHRDYKAFSLAQILASVVNVSFVLSFGLISNTQNNLIIGLLLGLSSAALYLSFVGLFDFKGSFIVRRCDFSYAFKHYSRFPCYVLPTSLILTGSQYMQPLIIASISDVELTGFYSIANRVVMVPVVILGGAVAESLKSEFIAGQDNSSRLEKLFGKVLLILSGSSVSIITMVFLLSDLIFPIIFGDDYIVSAQIAKAISLGIFSIFIYQCFYFLFTLLNKNKIGLVVQILITFIPLAVLTVMGRYTGLVSALYVWSLTTFVFCLIGLIVIKIYISRVEMSNVL